MRQDRPGRLPAITGTRAPILRRSDEALHQILRLIGQGAFSPSERLPSEPTLATRFGISRPILREALLRLREAGVIETRHGSGSYLREPPAALGLGSGSLPPADLLFAPIRSLAELHRFYEFRAGLEAETAAAAARRRLPAAMAAIRAALARLSRAAADRDLANDADVDFHMAVAAATENPFFVQALAGLRAPIAFASSLSRSLEVSDPAARLRWMRAEHGAVLEAIQAGDQDGARRAMRAHVENARSRVFEGPSSLAEHGAARAAPLPADRYPARQHEGGERWRSKRPL